MLDILYDVFIHVFCLALAIYIISIYTIIVEYNDTQNNEEYKK